VGQRGSPEGYARGHNYRGARAAGRIHQTGRIACVDLPAFPLQLLWREHPDWRGQPTAVVAADSPQAPLLWVSESARRVGILPGMRYVAALSLDSDLRAAPVTTARIEAAVASLHGYLLHYSPRVEPAAHTPGVFWLDAGGLERVGGTPAAWAERLWRRLRRARFVCGLTVGYSRFGSWCLGRISSRIHRGVVVLESAAAETAACRQVPLSRLDLPPQVRDDLAHLGLDTVRDLVDLPLSGLSARFGAATTALVLLARGERFDPLQPTLPPEPVRAVERLDETETDAWRLLFLVKRLLHPLLKRLATKCQAVTQLHLDLKVDSLGQGPATATRESLRPAAPTLDVVLLTELIRLRLEGLDLSAGIEEVAVELVATVAPPAALELFHQHHRRDLAAAQRAIARVRAELGDRAVVQAVMCPGHVPERACRWAPARELVLPTPARDPKPTLIRRLLPRARPLLSGPPDLLRTGGGDQLVRAAVGGGWARHSCGPHLVSAEWWDDEKRRAYYYVEASAGRLLWLYYDECEQRWYLQGTVE